MSIKKSLSIILIISSIIPVILISVIAHGLLTQRLIDVQTKNLQRIAEANKSGLEALIETQRTEVSLLSIQEEIQDLARNSLNNKDLDPSKVNEILSDRQSYYRSCEQISLYNVSREIISSSNLARIGQKDPNSLTLSYLFATRKIAVGIDGVKVSLKSKDNPYTLDIGTTIIDAKDKHKPILGYIISTVPITYFEDFLSTISIGETGHGLLLDSKGTVLFHPDSSRIGNPINSDQLSQIFTNYNSGLMASSGTLHNTYESSDKAYGFCVIPELNWVLLVTQDLNEMRSLTNIMLSLLIFVCAILLVLIIILASTLSKGFTAPIISLRDAMRIASNGNLTIQSNIKSKNELGELSKSFNKMLHVIKTNYEDLASMHEELLSNEEQLRSNYDRIEFLAYHDTLTNLPNKLSLLDHVNHVLVSSYHKQLSHAMLFIDLDNFKTINDTQGHDYGDALLTKIADIFDKLKGDNSILARAGGDEFLIFIEDIPSKDYAIEFASNLIETLKEPLNINGESIYASMSIGIAIYPDNGITSSALIKNADIAMYKSKETGKNKFTIFDKSMEEELSRSAIIMDVLRNAIDRQEIYVQYQPLIDVNTSSIIGFEALMRIHNEKLGNLSPEEFIPIAEESGLIVELSTWVLREACHLNKSLIDLGIPPLSVAVNISSVQISRPGFITTLSEILEETQLPPQYLELEITESTLVSSLVDASILLTKIQNLGVKISLDDFGTGYSSLNYLTKMPINTLKIDKSFIDNICYNAKDSCIAETIINLAHNLNIKVVAEGVESMNQLELLKIKNCDIIQGYLYSKPINAPTFIDKVKQHQLNIIPVLPNHA